MRYSKTHKEETRRKLLDSSRALVKKGGFDTTRVDALMASIGLTPGAFYGHFASKQALLTEVLREEMSNSVALFTPSQTGDSDELRQRIKAYLSPTHVKHPEIGCVMAAMGAELGRMEPEIKGIVEEGLLAIQNSARKALGSDDAAWAVISQCVGAVILARAVKSEAVRGEILRANRSWIEGLPAAANDAG